MERDLLSHRETNTCRLCKVTRCAEKSAQFVQNANKVKVKLSLYAITTSRRSSGIVPPILNFSTRWKWVVGLTFRSLYRRRVPGASGTVWSFLEMKWLWPCPKSNRVSYLPVCSLVTVLTALCRFCTWCVWLAESHTSQRAAPANTICFAGHTLYIEIYGQCHLLWML